MYFVHLIVDPPPNGVDFYIHRAGRTGRKGQPGRAIILYSDSDRFFMKEVYKVTHMWQSQIEIEYYSVAYFECITEFDAL